MAAQPSCTRNCQSRIAAEYCSEEQQLLRQVSCAAHNFMAATRVYCVFAVQFTMQAGILE